MYEEEEGRNVWRFFHEWSEWEYITIISTMEWWKRRQCIYCRRIEAEFIWREDRRGREGEFREEG